MFFEYSKLQRNIIVLNLPFILFSESKIRVPIQLVFSSLSAVFNNIIEKVTYANDACICASEKRYCLSTGSLTSIIYYRHHYYYYNLHTLSL